MNCSNYSNSAKYVHIIIVVTAIIWSPVARRCQRDRSAFLKHAIILWNIMIYRFVDQEEIQTNAEIYSRTGEKQRRWVRFQQNGAGMSTCILSNFLLTQQNIRIQRITMLMNALSID